MRQKKIVKPASCLTFGRSDGDAMSQIYIYILYVYNCGYVTPEKPWEAEVALAAAFLIIGVDQRFVCCQAPYFVKSARGWEGREGELSANVNSNSKKTHKNQNKAKNKRKNRTKNGKQQNIWTIIHLASATCWAQFKPISWQMRAYFGINLINK